MRFFIAVIVGLILFARSSGAAPVPKKGNLGVDTPSSPSGALGMAGIVASLEDAAGLNMGAAKRDPRIVFTPDMELPEFASDDTGAVMAGAAP
ncbi:unnamed protein product [Somion occarium]|uniref:Uncharacterized protein n=1 Tax=Somion occarium TaxID=3059160 RepID=A0ABP1CHY3_9APHY